MDKLRKIVAWIWRNKERMVLVVVVVVLGQRVYNVLNPPDPPPPKQYSYPRSEIQPEDYPQLGFPGAPPVPPPPLVPQVWSPLWKRNPFWFNPSDREGGTQDESQRDPGVYLIRIAPKPDGTFRAQLRTKATSTKWYDEGEPFEKFELISIDAENKTCEVYSEELGQRITIKQQK